MFKITPSIEWLKKACKLEEGFSGSLLELKKSDTKSKKKSVKKKRVDIEE